MIWANRSLDRPSDETLNQGPDSVVIKNPRMFFEKE